MKPELLLTKAWQHNAPWLTVLRPLSYLYGAVGRLHKNAYASGKREVYRAPVAVLVIGNITVGGSGKTPLIIALVDYLHTLGIAVGVISRGYGGDSKQMPCLVTKDSLPTLVGDEPCLIVQATNAPMAVSPVRKSAIQLLLQHYPNLQLIISDDGLQHYALARDAEWIVVDAMRGFGNERLLPEGFLREPLSRLNHATVLHHYPNAQEYNDSALAMYLQADKPINLLDNTQVLAPQSVYGLTGIGYPPRFFASLEALGFAVKARPKPDHHRFSYEDIATLSDLPVVVTAKDAVKLQALFQQHKHSDNGVFANVWVLPVRMQLSAGIYALMQDFLHKFVYKSTP